MSDSPQQSIEEFAPQQPLVAVAEPSDNGTPPNAPAAATENQNPFAGLKMVSEKSQQLTPQEQVKLANETQRRAIVDQLNSGTITDPAAIRHLVQQYQDLGGFPFILFSQKIDAQKAPAVFEYLKTLSTPVQVGTDIEHIDINPEHTPPIEELKKENFQTFAIKLLKQEAAKPNMDVNDPVVQAPIRILAEHNFAHQLYGPQLPPPSEMEGIPDDKKQLLMDAYHQAWTQITEAVRAEQIQEQPKSDEEIATKLEELESANDIQDIQRVGEGESEKLVVTDKKGNVVNLTMGVGILAMMVFAPRTFDEAMYHISSFRRFTDPEFAQRDVLRRMHHLRRMPPAEFHDSLRLMERQPDLFNSFLDEMHAYQPQDLQQLFNEGRVGNNQLLSESERKAFFTTFGKSPFKEQLDRLHLPTTFTAPAPKA